MSAEGWVLAGGRSLRMGRDKAGVMLAGRPLLKHVLDKLCLLGLRVRVAGLREPVSEVLADTVRDAHPDCGPLSGLETSLANCEADYVLAIAVDLPLVSAEFLAWMLARAEITGSMATVPRVGGEPQPLCAVCRRDMLATVRQALDIGDYKVMNALQGSGMPGELDVFDAETLTASGAWISPLPVHLQFMNCNTPQDLLLAEAGLTVGPML